MASASATETPQVQVVLEDQGFQLEDQLDDQPELLLFDNNLLQMIDQCVGDYFDDPNNVLKFCNGQFDLHGESAAPQDLLNELPINSCWNPKVSGVAADGEDPNIQDRIETSMAPTAEYSRKRKLELDSKDKVENEPKRRCSNQNYEAETSDSDNSSASDQSESEYKEDVSYSTENLRGQQVPSEGEGLLPEMGTFEVDDGGGFSAASANQSTAKFEEAGDQKATKEKNKYKCKYCDNIYTRNQTLKRHIKHNHNFQQLPELEAPSLARRKRGPQRKQRFPCSCCNREFLTKEDLTDHQNIINGNKAYVCEMCKASFYTRSSLCTHKKSHIDKLEKRFYCQICDKAFGHRNSFDYHKTHVHNEGINDLKFKCEFCDKRFMNAGYLKQHKWSHEKGEEHTCALCDKIFRNRHEYEKHMRAAHNGGKGQYKCDQCKAQFDRRNYLASHKRIHNGE